MTGTRNTQLLKISPRRFEAGRRSFCARVSRDRSGRADRPRVRIWLLAEVVFEQKELGNPPYGCELGAIDYAQVANACGAQGLRCTSPAGLRPAIDDMLRSSRAALLEVHVDTVEPVTLPSRLVA